MPLTQPTTDDLAAQMQVEELSEEEEIAAEYTIPLATALMEIAGGISEDPENPAMRLIVRAGILDMALWLMRQAEDRDQLYSPFTSERIGSYSYQKAAGAIRSGDPTGATLFDIAVAQLAVLGATDMGDTMLLSSERVFDPCNEGFAALEARAATEAHDPSWLSGDRYLGWPA